MLFAPCLFLVRQRLAGLRAELEYTADLVDKLLVLVPLATFEVLNVVGRHVDLLRQLGLGHLKSLLGASVLDGIAELGVGLGRRDDLVGAVDLGQALALSAFVGLKTVQSDTWYGKGSVKQGLPH